MSTTCPTCGTTSFNPNDERERYCGRCHQFYGDPKRDIGRELSVAELVPKTVVVIGREGDPTALTMWVRSVGVDYVLFGVGMLEALFLCNRRPDGTLYDDNNVHIRVFEFLGEV